ncbi:DNA alkylation repair protein [Bosea minatitlanensis]|uniref:DNA alkylation repair protein n=1 Tax=Bosea minatitlanensis TaxID=128782 RepID=A0ABW0F860_9HYPH|nr:DNA alkylation repair protein [Bosea minatitlanensis]MCT4494475.1 DNA alkylation repair protein [Bosea minatitlanensis]
MKRGRHGESSRHRSHRLSWLAKKTGRDHGRALRLWKTGTRDVRVLAIYTADPRQLTPEEARRWADDFDSWEIVDTAADLFLEAGLDQLIPEFAEDDREFVRRTAFAMIAGMAVHRKTEPDATLLGLLRLIERHSGDGRNFVRKAVNWALRNIGKRNLDCHGPALALAERLAMSADKTARWIGKDAVRELTTEKTLERLRRKIGSIAGGGKK